MLLSFQLESQILAIKCKLSDKCKRYIKSTKFIERTREGILRRIENFVSKNEVMMGLGVAT